MQFPVWEFLEKTTMLLAVSTQLGSFVCLCVHKYVSVREYKPLQAWGCTKEASYSWHT